MHTYRQSKLSFTYKTGSSIKSFHVTENDILAIIKALDPNKTHGCDNISIKMIKICSQSLQIYFTFKNYFRTLSLKR